MERTGLLLVESKQELWVSHDGSWSFRRARRQSPVWIWYDNLGREIRRDSYGLNNKKIMSDTEYDTKSNIYRTSDPYFENATTKTYAATYTYDSYGRISTMVTPMGTTNYAYSGLTTTVTSPDGTQKTTINNAGWTTVEETNGKKVNFDYYASGLVKTATPEGGQPLSMEYDLQGNRTKLTDPDAGVITSQYDGWGQLIREEQKIHVNANPIVTTYNYLTSGLLNYQQRNGVTTNYSYDNLYRLQQASIAGKHSQSYQYDQWDRVIQTTDVVDNAKTFISKTDYDVFGRVSKETYPSGYSITNQYDNYSYLTGVTDENGSTIWQAIESNAKGQLTRTQSGGKETTFGFNDKGLPTSIVTPGIANWSYVFDSKANLASRSDGIANYKDSLAYDALNRLTSWKVYQGAGLQQTNSVAYDLTTGNIQTKSDLDNYAMNYGEKGYPPHALTSISGVPSIISSADRTITYTDFKKVKQIMEGNNILDISYGIDEQRIKTTLSQPSGSLTRYYLGDYEEEVMNGNARKIHYISGGNGLAAIYVQNNGNDTLYYAHTDYQGSLIAISLQDGTVKERYAYDPWGNRRNPTNWTQRDARTAFIFNRGYTMHEHLSEFSLINMNGRVYDPLTSIFLSTDQHLQSPGDWLNYNRYSYALNNPFKYTDPSGEIIWFIPVIIGAIVGAYTGASVQSGTAAFWDWKPNAWQGAIAGGIIGATLGYGFSAAIGATGMTTSVTTAAGTTANVTTKAAGLVSSMFNSGSINIAMNAMSGGGWDGAWKAGVVGLASGAWTATGGFGMVKGFGATSNVEELAGKLGYQMIGTAGSSIGNNWARGDDLFSKVMLGVGPVNLTLGKGQNLLQWQNNLGNIITNTLGLGNLAFGGKVSFDWKNLATIYTGGLMEYMGGAWGPYSVMGPNGPNNFTQNELSHEMHHIWQSRSLGDIFILNYGLQGIDAVLRGKSFSEFIFEMNYFETQAYGHYWFNP